VTKIKVGVILGTRPEIIKLSPVIDECIARDIDFFITHTGQHYSYELDKIFLEELKLPQPKYNIEVGSLSHGAMTGRMLERLEKVFLQEKPDVILVEGDTNTVLAGALTAVKMGIKVGHVEAGLRSHDKRMPEEHNRKLADHISDYLFAPTQLTKQNLLKENIPEKNIFVTGNTIVDAVNRNIVISNQKSDILKNLNLKKEEYIVTTLHRQENVDNLDFIKKVLNTFKEISDKYGIKIIYPIHPRTNKMIDIFNIRKEVENISDLSLITPLGYIDFLKLQANAKMVITDSGGIQEESCILKVPCATFRLSTERPETVEVGSNIVSGLTQEGMISSIHHMMNKKDKDWINPLGDGTAAKKIVTILENDSRSLG